MKKTTCNLWYLPPLHQNNTAPSATNIPKHSQQPPSQIQCQHDSSSYPSHLNHMYPHPIPNITTGYVRNPSNQPTNQPTNQPSNHPTIQPSNPSNPSTNQPTCEVDAERIIQVEMTKFHACKMWCFPSETTHPPPKKNQPVESHGDTLHWKYWLPGTPSVLSFLGNFTPKTSNYCLKNRALGFPGCCFSGSKKRGCYVFLDP